MTPIVEIKADGNKVSQSFNERLMSIEINDSNQGTTDTLLITLSDVPSSDGKYIELPVPGTIIDCSIGYKESGTHNTRPNSIRSGKWTVTGVSCTGGSGGDIVTINSMGQDMSTDVKKHKDVAWINKTLGEIVKTIAGYHNLNPRLSNGLSNINSGYEQQSESDMAFITRLASKYHAYGKIRGDDLIFIEKNSGYTENGESLPTVIITKDMLTSWNYAEPSSKKYNKFTTKYYDYIEAKYIDVSIGEGRPELFIPSHGKIGKDSALYILNTKRMDSNANKTTLTISGSLPTDNILLPETRVSISDLRPPLSGAWVVSSQSIKFDVSGLSFNAKCVRLSTCLHKDKTS